MLKGDNPYRIVLADDHEIFRHNIKRMIEENSDLHVVGEASDGNELLALLNNMTPQMVILDISMPNLNGIEATNKIKMKYPDIDILILTIHKEKEYLERALSAGAEGYLLKDNVNAELFKAIETIRNRRVYIPGIFSENE
jgi:DNA-binding NarL/FixJ family response regulator